MVLPLLGIMGLGAGVLGGGRYLLDKADQRRAQEKGGQLEQMLSTSTLPQHRQDQIRRQAQGILQEDGGIFGMMDAGQRMGGLLSGATNLEANYIDQQQQTQAAALMAAQQGAMGYENDIQADTKAARERYGGIQNTSRSMLDLIDSGRANAFEATRAIYQYLDLLAPGEIKTESDIENVAAAGGVIGNLAQKYLTAVAAPNVVDRDWLSGLRRDVLSLAQGEERRWKSVDANIRDRIKNNPYSDHTRYRNVVGGYGIDPEHSFSGYGSMPGAQPEAQAPPPGQTTEDAREALAQSRGRTTKRPGDRRGSSVRELRGR